MGHVGQQIRLLREERGLSQTQLAASIGTGPSAISEMEHGKRNPNSTTLIKLAGALEVEVSDLFPKAQAPLQLELEDQAGQDGQELDELEEDTAGQREEREKLVIALLMNWTETWGSFEEELKSETEGLPLGAAYHFGIDSTAARLLYEFADSGQASKDLREAWGSLDALCQRIRGLLDQLEDPGDKEDWDTRRRFAERRAETLQIRKARSEPSAAEELDAR